MYYIYLIKNTINNKIYIGQTNNPKKRWQQHKKPSTWKQQTNSHLYRAMKSYGKENFIFDIIAKTDSIYVINLLEETLIKQYNSTNRKIGYNIDGGGKNRNVSKETKLKMSLAQKGKKKSKEHCKNLSKALKGRIITQSQRDNHSLAMRGENNPMYGIPSPNTGKKFTEEHKRKISAATTGKKKIKKVKNVPL